MKNQQVQLKFTKNKFTASLIIDQGSQRNGNFELSIGCKFRIINWHRAKKQYTCTDVNTTQTFQKIKKINGEHEEGKSNKDVKGIYFNRTILKYFPRDLQKHFPNLTHLSIAYCGISKITRCDLKGLESLVCLEICRSELRSLPDDLLADLPNLRTIFFTNNKIEFASSKLLEPFAGRTDVEVSLIGNKNIDARFIPNNPNSLKSIKELMEMIDEKCKKPKLYDRDRFFESIGELWTSGRFSDFTIVAGAKEFKVHKNILGIQSSVFAKIVEDHNEATELKIKDFSPNAVESLLHFMYTGEIQNEDNEMENFAIADNFKVTKMKSAYEEIISDKINEENAFEIFMLAHQHSAKDLKEKAFHVVARLFPTKLPDKMMQDPEKLRKAVDAYRELQKIIAD